MLGRNNISAFFGMIAMKLIDASISVCVQAIYILFMRRVIVSGIGPQVLYVDVYYALSMVRVPVF